MAGQKVKVKVKKKKIKIKRLILTLIFFVLIFYLFYLIITQPIKNIYIEGNNIVSDEEIIELAKIENYPSYIKTYFIKIKDNIKKNDYIDTVKIMRKFPNKIYIKVTEYRPLFIYKNKVVLSSTKQVANKYSETYLPEVINNIDDIYEETVKNFVKINDENLSKISHIEYIPNEVDKERFIFYMNDANYIYINLSTIEKMNKYSSIVKELDGKKGIIYLDSGDYFEIKQ